MKIEAKKKRRIALGCIVLLVTFLSGTFLTRAGQQWSNIVELVGLSIGSILVISAFFKERETPRVIEDAKKRSIVSLLYLFGILIGVASIPLSLFLGVERRSEALTYSAFLLIAMVICILTAVVLTYKWSKPKS